MRCLGKRYEVYPNVFSPKYFSDSAIFAAHLPVRRGDTLLEIGCGTGIVAIEACFHGARSVVATDIEATAVRNTKENVHRLGLDRRIAVRRGDLFESIRDGELFDCIFWNFPFGGFSTASNERIPALFDGGYRMFGRYLRAALQHRARNGRIFVGYSSTIGNSTLLWKRSLEAGIRPIVRYHRTVVNRYQGKLQFEIIEMVERDGEVPQFPYSDSVVPVLQAGGIVVIPTDTAYALAADATNREAVTQVRTLKGRKVRKPIAVIAADLAQVRAFFHLTPSEVRLARRFWPGPLTIVLTPKRSLAKSSLARGGIGVRVPANAIARRIAHQLGRPITATSANCSGGPTPYSVAAVLRQFPQKKPDCVLEGGRLPRGPVSTVVRLRSKRIEVVRPGAIPSNLLHVIR